MKRHLNLIGTQFTLCGEDANPRDNNTTLENVTCSICVRQQFEGEIEYIRRVNREEEDKILTRIFIVLVGTAFAIVTLLSLIVANR